MMVKILYSKREGIYSLGSRVIMAAQGLPFSHVSIAVKIGNNPFEVYESVWPKSRKISYKEWLTHYKLVSSHELPEVDDKLQLVLEAMVGKTYSVSQLVVIYFNMFFSKLDSSWVNGSRKLICTELSAIFMFKAYGTIWSKALDMISLRDIYREARKIGV